MKTIQVQAISHNHGTTTKVQPSLIKPPSRLLPQKNHKTPPTLSRSPLQGTTLLSPKTIPCQNQVFKGNKEQTCQKSLKKHQMKKLEMRVPMTKKHQLRMIHMQRNSLIQEPFNKGRTTPLRTSSPLMIKVYKLVPLSIIFVLLTRLFQWWNQKISKKL